jgi:hypothetical protein
MADVDSQAPVRASAETLIQAPLFTVWSVQSDIASWPTWNREISKVDIHGPLAPGTRFRWKAAGLTISSELIAVKPLAEIAWTGRTLGIRATHVWLFEELGALTGVTTKESFDGLLPRMLKGVMQRMLEGSLRRALAMLKTECERRARAAK